MQKFSGNFLLICFSLFVIFGLTNQRTPGKDKCYVLALEGGGDKGAYQAGAIEGLVKYMNRTESQWDVVTGISVGALNGAGLSLFDIGDEETASNYLVSKWRTIKGNSDIFKNWWLGPLYALISETGLYDTSPLREYLHEIIGNKTLKRHFTVGATNIKNGIFDIYNDNNLNADEYIDAIMSSAAFPVIFPNLKFQNNSYMDGGVKMSINIASGVNTCLDQGYTEEEIIVDAILCNSHHLIDLEPENLRPISVLIRLLEIFGYDYAMRDIYELQFIFSKVEFRYLVAPSKSLPSGLIPLTFSPAQIEIMIEQGIQDAQRVIEQGTGKNFKELAKAYKISKLKDYGLKEKYASEAIKNLNLGQNMNKDNKNFLE